MSPGIKRHVSDPAPQMESLTLREYQRILMVLRRDAALRNQERERISKLRSSLQSEGEDEGCPRCETSASGRKCSVCARRREVKLQSGDWFYRNIQSRFSRTAPLTENNRALENGTAMDPDSAQIREFIERLVEALVSGQLDDVKVNRVYTHPEYDRMFACHHTALCENLVRLSFALQMAIANKPLPEDETPSAVHAALKQRVQRIIDEAMTLPNLKSQVPVQNGNSPQKWDDDITSMTYEDILATAILNKVIEQFQHRTGVVLRDTVDGNSNLLTPALNSMDRAPKFISRVEIGVNGQDDEDSSSKEGLKNWSETNLTEPLSMTIEECIEEEVTMYDSAGEEEGGGSSDGMATTGSELDFYLSGLSFIKNRRVPFPELGVDIVDGSKEGNSDEEDEHSDSSQSLQPTDLISPVDSWEENWLFQRRHLKAGGSTQRSPMPVPMLVPNPSEDFRARIGDRDAEEVSDLSDCSDGALEDIVLSGVDTDAAEFQLPKISVNCESHGATAQPIKEGRVTGQSAAEQSVSTELTEATNVELVKASSVECLSEFGQQDSEYTEDYASVTQRQLSSLTEQIVWAEPVVPTPVPKPRTLPVASLPTKSRDWCPQEDSKLATPPQPGTIAEREHRKWESALPLPNNPYSPENINKRLSKQSTRYSSRSSSATSLDFPELKAESPVPSPLQVVCTSGEPDYKRYGRDYYINQSKSSSGERCSSSRVNSPLLQQKCVDLTDQETEEEQIFGVQTPDTNEIAKCHVEIEIAKWQKEINETEQQWLRRLQHSGSLESTATQNGGAVLTEAKTPAAAKDAASHIQNSGKQHRNSVQAARGKIVEEGEGRNSGHVTPSECSTVSSDLDFDADVPITLPSVKELAKHFSGGATSDSDSSVSKVVSPNSRHSKLMEATKVVVIVEREKRPQPMREVHSLTARSISREFREGLRRNLPTHLDRNLHTTTDITASNGIGDSSCSSPELMVTNGNGDSKMSPVKRSRDVGRASVRKAGKVRVGPKYGSIKETSEGDRYDPGMRGDDSTPSYTSDESGTQSPTPPMGGSRKLQNNIAFWEQLQRSGK